jgi:hypothetical protein
MRNEDFPNFSYGQGRPQFNASSSIQNSVLLRIQLKDFMVEQAKINKDTINKFKGMDKVLDSIDGKVTEVGTSNHQVLNMMRVVGQLAKRLTGNEGRLSGQPQGPETVKAIQTRSGRETEDPQYPVGARKFKLTTEAETVTKEKVPTPTLEIVTEEPEFDMSGQDTKMPPLKPRYFQGKIDNHFEKFVEVM